MRRPKMTLSKMALYRTRTMIAPTTVLRYTHVHGRHIDQAIRSLERRVQGNGGRKRNRTAVHGFAVRCIATLPSGQYRKSLGTGDIGARHAEGQGVAARRHPRAAA